MSASPDIPLPGARWTPARKALVLDHLRQHPDQHAAIRARYALSPAEIAEWANGFAAGGIEGLRSRHRSPRRLAPGGEDGK